MFITCLLPPSSVSTLDAGLILIRPFHIFFSCEFFQRHADSSSTLFLEPSSWLHGFRSLSSPIWSRPDLYSLLPPLPPSEPGASSCESSCFLNSPITRLASQGYHCGTMVLWFGSTVAVIFSDIVLLIIFKVLPPLTSTTEVKASSSLSPLNPECTFPEWSLPLSLCVPSALSAAGSFHCLC